MKLPMVLIAAFPAFAFGFDCPVSTLDLPDPRGAMAASISHGWYGTENLAALIPRDGRWSGMGPAHSYGDKFWWWAHGYSAHDQPEPNLAVSAIRLDEPGEQVSASDATNGFGDNWDAITLARSTGRSE